MKWDSRVGQYRGDNGRFISRADVISIIDSEVENTKAQLRNLARKLDNAKIPLDKFQKDYLTVIRDSHTRLAMLASGGKKGLTPRVKGYLGFIMSEQTTRIRYLGEDLKEGKLTLKQLLARSDMYAENTRQSFYWGDKNSQQIAGKNQARRLLTPGFNHCPECVSYEQKIWTEIGNIIPIGSSCSCRGRCKCRIFYRAYK